MCILNQSQMFDFREGIKIYFHQGIFLMWKVSMGESTQEVSLLAFVLIKGAAKIQ